LTTPKCLKKYTRKRKRKYMIKRKKKTLCYHQKGLTDSDDNDTLTTSDSETRNSKVIKSVTL
jgi:hypothetical protein